MKIIKTLLIIILMISMLFILTACESKKESNDDNEIMGYLSQRKNNQNNNDNQSDSKNDIQTFLNKVKSLTSEEAMANAEKQMEEPKEGDKIAIFHIENYGDVTVKLFDNIAPKAVENFVTHAEEGYYNGVIFHRVIEEFMIQGGDPLGTGRGGESIWGSGFEEELDASVLPYKGALCMASAGSGTSSLGSQFFIVQGNYNDEKDTYIKNYGLSNLIDASKKYNGDVGRLVGLGQYTTFGQVIDGLDIIDEIAKVETDSNDKPLENVVISSVEITTYSK